MKQHLNIACYAILMIAAMCSILKLVVEIANDGDTVEWLGWTFVFVSGAYYWTTRNIL